MQINRAQLTKLLSPQYLKDFIFKQSCNFNVIGVDWRNASQTCNYFNSVADTQIVGAVVAGFLRNLMQAHNQSAQQVTIVGHSLGAHVSGFIGANFTNPKLRSILGLDPAGPAFRDIATRFRLDPSDADLVVTLTTNAGLTSLNGNGLNKGVGHYSFFVNGGYHQPGCTGRPGDAVSILETLFSSSASCSHQRPTWLIQVAGDEAGECQSMGYQCQSYEAFVGGECGTCDEGSDQCMPLHSFFNFWNQEFDRLKQMRSNNGSLVYYVDTSEEMPYCVCHYQLILTTAQGDSFKGNFKMALEGELRDLDGFQFKKDNFNIKPNATFKALVKVAKNIGKLKSIQIEAIQEKGLILPSSTKRITIKSIELNYMSALTLRFDAFLTSVSLFQFFFLLYSERKRYSTKAEFGPQQNTTLGTDGPATRLFIN